MIAIKISKGIFSYTQKWLFLKPNFTDAFKFVEFICASSTNSRFGFKRERHFTKVIDLSKKPEEVLELCRKNTKYEIKRADKEDVRFGTENDVNAFMDFYNLFVESKDILGENLNIDKDYFYLFKESLVITKAVFGNEILVMHSYITSKEAKRTRLLNTASLFRYEDDAQKKNLTGRANRFLHYQDMVYFKNQGFYTYDFGGYAYKPEDIEKVVFKRINEFKDSFGGELLEESRYISLPLYILMHIISMVKKVFKN